MKLRCWGTRGSIASPGPHTYRYGGNTSCVEILSGSRQIILDAGTGIRRLGKAMELDGGVCFAEIFLTHFHWDHIQGFPFFSPLYNPCTRMRVYGPDQESLDIESLFMRMMSPIHFPVPFDAVQAVCQFERMNQGIVETDDFSVEAFRVRHDSFTVGYRVTAGDRSVCYIPDNELLGDGYPTPPDWRDRILEFVSDADLLIHDAMYTEAEYPEHLMWGHSTANQALDLASEAGVKRLWLFHHEPERSDDQLDQLESEIQERSAALPNGPQVSMAAEGMEIEL